MNLREVREAAERLLGHYDVTVHDDAKVAKYAIATIDPSPDAAITAGWLMENWWFKKSEWSRNTYENGHATMICWGGYWNYEDDYLNWPHNLTTRQEFCDLARCLGIPRKDGAK